MRKAVFGSLAILAMLFWGLVMLHCGNGGPECQTDADCLQKHGAGWICDSEAGECVLCTPDCTGKCCGPNGCGGTCPDDCPTGYTCNPASCDCETDPGECTDDQDCINVYGDNYTCNLTTNQCECNPDCAGKCCGPNGCGGDCPDACTPPSTCNQTTCECESPPCTSDSQCATTECCKEGKCEAEDCAGLDCGPDRVCGRECGPCDTGETCVDGKCEAGGDVLCPEGQSCELVTQDGMKACVIAPLTIPTGTPVCSAADPSCEGNRFCLQVSDTEFYCVEICGSCPDGQECFTIGGGLRVCLTPEGQMPANPPPCSDTVDCTGNTICLINSSTGDYLGCAYLCSNDYNPCTNGERKCEGDVVMECQNNAWVEVETCDPDTQICEDGACVDLQSCSMANGAGDCPQGEMCYPWDQACTVFNCYQAGTVAVGGTCEYVNDCVPGAMCMGDSICYQVCSDTITCTAPETCQNIQDCPTDFGICATQ
jgi:hypothetical protein